MITQEEIDMTNTFATVSDFWEENKDDPAYIRDTMRVMRNELSDRAQRIATLEALLNRAQAWILADIQEELRPESSIGLFNDLDKAQ